MCSGSPLSPVTHIRSAIKNPLNPFAADPLASRGLANLAPKVGPQRGLLGKVTRLAISRRS